ncbi:hypothetical protein GmHk_13G038214 [Glycine max]|nr:hypothetical protein GmHk_13G038214 [Glycine max]
MFGTIVDRIWPRRNEFIFNNKWTNTLSLVLSVWSGVRDISQSKLTHMVLAPNDDNDNHNASQRWKKFLQGYKAIIVETDYAEVVNLVEDPRYREGQFVDLASKICAKSNTMTLFAKNDLTINNDECFYDSLPNVVVTSMRMDANVGPSILSNI